MRIGLINYKRSRKLSFCVLIPYDENLFILLPKMQDYIGKSEGFALSVIIPFLFSGSRFN